MNDISQVSSNIYSSYGDYKSTAAKSFLSSQKAEEAKAADGSGKKEEEAAVFEKSDGSTVSSSYKPNEALKAKLKADLDAQVQNMRSIVENLITGQGKAFGAATGDDDFWKLFAEGDFSNVDDAAKAQAQKDIAEGGYWSVEETANRIVDFAKALTGGDPSKIDAMTDAFKKGFDEATKAWGKDLPEISSKTYDAVMKGFDEWKQSGSTAE
jgi:hypothetical protein